MIQSGNLDTLISIEQRAGTQESELGTYSYAWTELASVWADVQDILPSRAERVAEGVSLQRRPTRIRIRYRNDVTSDMRIVAGSNTYRIIGGPAELGRQAGLEMVCEELTTEGIEP